MKVFDNKRIYPVFVPGISKEQEVAIEEAMSEFEDKHEYNALHGGDGWVPRIKPIDYILAIVPNAIFVIWLIIAFLT